MPPMPFSKLHDPWGIMQLPYHLGLPNICNLLLAFRPSSPAIESLECHCAGEEIGGWVVVAASHDGIVRPSVWIFITWSGAAMAVTSGMGHNCLHSVQFQSVTEWTILNRGLPALVLALCLHFRSQGKNYWIVAETSGCPQIKEKLINSLMAHADPTF